jgi:HK97 gp10 family phage protein
MASFSIRITGNTGDIAAKIEKKKQQITAVLAKTAADCQALAQQNAPVDTGFLKNSIHMIKVDETHYMVVVGASYAWFVELGTHKMHAQPFLMPAFVTTSKQALALLQKVAAA